MKAYPGKKITFKHFLVLLYLGIRNQGVQKTEQRKRKRTITVTDSVFGCMFVLLVPSNKLFPILTLYYVMCLNCLTLLLETKCVPTPQRDCKSIFLFFHQTYP